MISVACNTDAKYRGGARSFASLPTPRSSRGVPNHSCRQGARAIAVTGSYTLAPTALIISLAASILLLMTAPIGQGVLSAAASGRHGAPESPVTMRAKLPDEMERRVKAWDRKLSRLARSIAHDLTGSQQSPITADLESPETKSIRQELCRSLARAFDSLGGGNSILAITDALAERLRLSSIDLLLLVLEGQSAAITAPESTIPGSAK